MTKRFLLADDDADDRELFCEAVLNADPAVTCYCAGDGFEVLEKLDSQEYLKPDIIFLDINMSAMSGWQCLTRLKESEAYRHIPVVIYSTSSNQRDINKALELGASCFFTKPSDFRDLIDILTVMAANVDGDLFGSISKFDGINLEKSFASS